MTWSTSSTDFQFMRWLLRLNGQLNSLVLQVRVVPHDELERKTNTAQAELEHLYAYAQQHSVAVEPHLQLLTNVETQLATLHDWLAIRPEPWWSRAFHFVVGALDIVANLVGLGSLFARWRLPGTDRRRLLPGQ
jgi:hypothetical protein